MNDDVYYVVVVVVDFYDEKFVPSFKQLNKTNKGENGRKIIHTIYKIIGQIKKSINKIPGSKSIDQYNNFHLINNRS